MNSWSGKKVLVTGGCGFIGSHLVESLVHLGADVEVLGRYNSLGTKGWLENSPRLQDIQVRLGDVRDSEFVDRCVQGKDVVFHLAALIGIPYSYVAPISYVQTNIEGTLNVLMSCRRHEVGRLVHTSTSEVYGTALEVPISESHPLQGQSPYSASKIGADKLVESFFCSFDTPVVTVRPFNTFGPRQSTRAVIPTIICQALAGNSVRLGSLTPTRDFNYVDNTVDGFIRASQQLNVEGEVLNLGTGVEVSIGEVASMVGSILGKTLEIVSVDQRLRPGKSEVNRLLADASRAKKMLDWSPKFSLEEGLVKTVEWLSGHRDRLNVAGYAI